jgi:hypothetical protein
VDLALVINAEGFIKYSSVFEGNMQVNNRFQENFEKGLSAVCASLFKKSGIKTEEKVYERVGRLKQKYPSVSRYYNIDYKIEVESKTNRKTKQIKESRKVTAMSRTVKPDIEVNEQSGTYFLRTSLSMSENTTRTVYNIIREAESTFRTLKTDLDLRPIYHKKDESTMAHLHLGLLAYWIVNTIRYRFGKRESEDKDSSMCSDKNVQIPEK